MAATRALDLTFCYLIRRDLPHLLSSSQSSLTKHRSQRRRQLHRKTYPCNRFCCVAWRHVMKRSVAAWLPLEQIGQIPGKSYSRWHSDITARRCAVWTHAPFIRSTYQPRRPILGPQRHRTAIYLIIHICHYKKFPLHNIGRPGVNVNSGCFVISVKAEADSTLQRHANNAGYKLSLHNCALVCKH
jgi:hypothetical protein